MTLCMFVHEVQGTQVGGVACKCSEDKSMEMGDISLLGDDSGEGDFSLCNCEGDNKEHKDDGEGGRREHKDDGSEGECREHKDDGGEGDLEEDKDDGIFPLRVAMTEIFEKKMIELEFGKLCY